MANRGASAQRRVELNRAVLDAVTLATADGLFELAKAAVNGAVVPVGDPPRVYRGQPTRPLHESGGVVAWVRGKKVATTTIDGQQIKAPRRAGVSRLPIAVIGGYGFPGNVVEFGTVKTAPEPFLTPSLLRVVPEAVAFVRLGMTKHALVREVVKGLKVAAAAGDEPRVRAGRRAARRIAQVGPK